MSKLYGGTVPNGKLYGGTATNGKLYEWNGVDAWVEKAPKLGAETRIMSLAVMNVLSKASGGRGFRPIEGAERLRGLRKKALY